MLEPPSLSKRQIEVLEMIAAGLTVDQIAAQLGVSTRTVEWHLGRAMQQLQASTRTEAVARALTYGLIAQATGRSSDRSSVTSRGWHAE